MAVAVVPAAECSSEQMSALFESASWPTFIGADAEAALHLPTIRTVFADDELALLERDRVLAAGWGVRIRWDGSVGQLPSGYSGSLARSLRDRDEDRRPDTFVLCAIQVDGREGGRSLAGTMITALTEHAVDHGLHQVIAPLRPTLKHRYPLIPIAEYASWVRGDGTPLDPWLRTHVRMGARILATDEGSQTFTGTVAQWEQWSGLALPASGSYVVPDALAPLTVDRPGDLGVCVEPGIWVQHR